MAPDFEKNKGDCSIIKAAKNLKMRGSVEKTKIRRGTIFTLKFYIYTILKKNTIPQYLFLNIAFFLLFLLHRHILYMIQNLGGGGDNRHIMYLYLRPVWRP